MSATSTTNNAQTTEHPIPNNAQTKNQNNTKNTILEVVEVGIPVIKAVAPKTGAVVDTAIKLNKHANKPNPKSPEVISDLASTAGPFIKEVYPNAATALQTGTKGLKALTNDKPITRDLDTILQIISAFQPIINRVDPRVGAAIEFTVKFGKLYNNSKLTFTNPALFTDIIDTVVPVIKLEYKTVGVVLEVFVNFMKTETGDKVVNFLKIKVFNSPTPSNENEKLGKNKAEKELQNTSDGEAVIHLANKNVINAIEKSLKNSNISLKEVEISKNTPGGKDVTQLVDPDIIHAIEKVFKNSNTSLEEVQISKIANIVVHYMGSPKAAQNPEKLQNNDADNTVDALGQDSQGS